MEEQQLTTLTEEPVEEPRPAKPTNRQCPQCRETFPILFDMVGKEIGLYGHSDSRCRRLRDKYRLRGEYVTYHSKPNRAARRRG